MHNPEPTQIHFASRGEREKEREGSVREKPFMVSDISLLPQPPGPLNSQAIHLQQIP